MSSALMSSVLAAVLSVSRGWSWAVFVQKEMRQIYLVAVDAPKSVHWHILILKAN